MDNSELFIVHESPKTLFFFFLFLIFFWLFLLILCVATGDPRSAAAAASASLPEGDHHLGQAFAAAAAQGSYRAPGAAAHQAAVGDRGALAALRGGEASRHLSEVMRARRRRLQAQERHRAVGGAARGRQEGGQVHGRDQGQSSRVRGALRRHSQARSDPEFWFLCSLIL